MAKRGQKKSGQDKSKKGAVKAELVLIKGYLKKIVYILKPLDALYVTLVFASIPVLAFWTKSNTDELSAAAMTRTFVVTWLASAAIFAFWYLVLKRDRYKALLLALFTVVVSFNYAQIFRYYQKTVNFLFQIKENVESDALLLVLLAIMTVVLAIAVRRKVVLSNTLKNYLLLLATILLAINIYPLLTNWPSEDWKSDTSFGPAITSNTEPTSKPSIYYIVPDRYASNETLKSDYGFDNKDFLSSLESEGFYVADKAVANYPFTRMSLSSSLNMRYFPESYINSEETGKYYRLLQHKLEDNKVAQFLKEKGYNFINMGPWWDPTKYNHNSDQDLFYPSGVVILGKEIDIREQEMLVLQDTVFWSFFKRNIVVNGRRVLSQTVLPGKESTARVVHRRTIMHQLQKIEEVSNQKGPKFVFMHMLFPHDPYVLDENCNDFKERYDDEYVVYLNQLKCSNKKFLEMVQQIKTNDPNSVIIIQADEGPYPRRFRASDKDNFEWKKAADDELRHKSRILNAYYFPDQNYQNLYEHITPVNTFRTIFDQYLGTDLGRIDDKNYFPESVPRRFFLFDVTDTVRPQ